MNDDIKSRARALLDSGKIKSGMTVEEVIIETMNELTQPSKNVRGARAYDTTVKIVGHSRFDQIYPIILAAITEAEREKEKDFSETVNMLEQAIARAEKAELLTDGLQQQVKVRGEMRDEAIQYTNAAEQRAEKAEAELKDVVALTEAYHAHRKAMVADIKAKAKRVAEDAVFLAAIAGEL